ncbi:hypothetical protein ACH5RR_003502, partial [Cinchona calisaya]
IILIRGDITLKLDMQMQQIFASDLTTEERLLPLIYHELRWIEFMGKKWLVRVLGKEIKGHRGKGKENLGRMGKIWKGKVIAGFGECYIGGIGMEDRR